MKGSIIASCVFNFLFLLWRSGVVDSKILSKNKVTYLRRKNGKEQKRVRSKRTLEVIEVK